MPYYIFVPAVLDVFVFSLFPIRQNGFHLARLYLFLFDKEEEHWQILMRLFSLFQRYNKKDEKKTMKRHAKKSTVIYFSWKYS
jgi:hypothetical protein